MTIEQAIKILHPDTSQKALWDIGYYAGFNGKEATLKACTDACIVACEVIKRLQKESIELRQCLKQLKYSYKLQSDRVVKSEGLMKSNPCEFCEFLGRPKYIDPCASCNKMSI